MGHTSGLGHVHADHILKQLEQAFGAAGVELLGGLSPLRHKAGTRGDPLFKVLVVHQFLHGLVLEFAKARLPQIVHRKGVGRVGEQDVGRFHRTQHGRGEHGVHLGVLKAFLQFGQLGTALVAQRDVGAAADVQALQVAGGHAVTDEMKFKCFHA